MTIEKIFHYLSPGKYRTQVPTIMDSLLIVLWGPVLAECVTYILLFFFHITQVYCPQERTDWHIT